MNGACAWAFASSLSRPNCPAAAPPTSWRSSPAGLRFHLECIVARGMPDAAVAAARRRAAVLRALEETRATRFLLDVDARGSPASSVSTRALRRELEAWLSGLNPEAVGAALARGETVPVFVRDLDGMRIIVRPMPLRRVRSGDRAVGVLFEGVRRSLAVPGIRKPLIEKATRYGDPQLPLVVAVDAACRDARLLHVEEALFGTEVWGLTEDGEPIARRACDGVWMGRDGPRCRALSAVLAAERLDAWTIANRSARLFENPWARRPAVGLEFGVDALRWQDHATPVETVGRPLRDVLGLPERWPEE